MKPQVIPSNAIVIEVDGSMRLIDVEQRGMLPVLQKVVGGYVEVVSNATADFWVNEEGNIAGLPVNRLATEMFDRHEVILVGPVVLTKLEG